MERCDLMPSVFVKFFEDAVERTEAEIEELRLAGLLRDDPQPQADVVGADVTPPQSAARVPATPPVVLPATPPLVTPSAADKKE